MQVGLSSQGESRNALSTVNEADLGSEIARRLAENVPVPSLVNEPLREGEGLGEEEAKSYDTGNMDCYEEGTARPKH